MKRYFILGLLAAGLIVLAIVSGGVWNSFFGPPGADQQPPSSINSQSGGGRVLVFWEPFLTEPQAERFATRLSEQSGVNVRAEGEGRQYRVAFNFQGEADLNEKVDHIESSTTFDIRGSYFQRIYLLPGENAASREDAEARAQRINRITGVELFVVATADYFTLGIGYTQETDLLNAIQLIESLSNNNEPVDEPSDEPVGEPADNAKDE